MSEQTLPPEFEPWMAEGVHIPGYCPRGRDDCCALSQVIAEGHKSFICCGETSDPPIPQDKYVVCFKNDVLDERGIHDKRDLMQTAAVMMGALSIIENRDCGEYDFRGEDAAAVERQAGEGMK